MSDGKADAQILLNATLPFAEQMLADEGEFCPFGGAMKPNGEIVSVSGFDGREHPPSRDIIELLANGFREAAQVQEYIATAIIYDARVIPPGETQQSDAIAAELEHRDGYAVTVYFPYQLEAGLPSIGTAFASASSRNIFRN